MKPETRLRKELHQLKNTKARIDNGALIISKDISKILNQRMKELEKELEEK